MIDFLHFGFQIHTGIRNNLIIGDNIEVNNLIAGWNEKDKLFSEG